MSAPAPQPKPLAGAQLAVTAIALALGTFMQVLDTTIANVSLPTIAGNLGASTDQGTWVITSFAVSNGIAVPLTGWLMVRFGVVRTFVTSVALFTLASLLCGIAWSLPALIVFRIFQGAVSGPMIPGSQALLISIFPPEKRATALGIWSITTLIAPILGPILGGIISDNIAWGWIFLINVPVGIASAVLCWSNLAKRETPTRKLPIDSIGLGLLVVWVGALQIMLDLGKDADWFASTHIVILGLVAAVGCAAWLIWELTEAHPIVDLSLFKNRNFAVGTLTLCIGYAVFFANILLLPLWLQVNLGYTATWAGLVAAPSGIVAVFLTPMTARMLAKTDARRIATVAFVAFAVSYFMRANFTNDATFWDFVMPLLVQGIAMATFFVTMITLSLDGIPPARIPAASGISNFMRITAGSFAASVTTTLWDRREALHQSRLADNATLYSPLFRQALERLHHLGLTDLQAYAVMTRNLLLQAYLKASTDLFWASGWVSVVGIGLIWLTRRPGSAKPPAVAADGARRTAWVVYPRISLGYIPGMPRPVFGPSPALVRALTRLLKPLIRLLIARGVTFPYLMNLLKRLYVTAAEESLAAEATISRLSIATGLQRKDINRIKSEPSPEVAIPEATSLGPRLIGIWLGDPAFRARRGGARPLPRTSADPKEKSFEDLVHSISTDVRPKVILEEWVRLGIVTVDKDDVVRLKSDAFVPEEGFDEKAYYLGRNVADHIATSVSNLLAEKEPMFERAVYYDRLSEDSVAHLRKRAREYAMTALVALNKDALKRADDDADKPGADRRMALGIYYYDGPDEGAQAPPAKGKG